MSFKDFDHKEQFPIFCNFKLPCSLLVVVYHKRNSWQYSKISFVSFSKNFNLNLQYLRKLLFGRLLAESLLQFKKNSKMEANKFFDDESDSSSVELDFIFQLSPDCSFELSDDW